MLKNITRVIGSLSLILFSSGVLFAQTDERIIEFYGAEKVAELESTSPQFMNYLNYYVEHGYEVLDNVPDYKLEALPSVSELSSELATLDPEALRTNFNILKYASPRLEEKAAIYRIENTNSVLVLTSKKQLMLLFKETQK